MAILKQHEVLKMQTEEKLKKIKEFKLELAKERSSVAIGGTVKNPGRLKEIKRTVARIKTSLNNG
ncbi:MAG: 50S ribosomal protein L29 [Candidatus Aenigmatarchaeota archaeon]|nr:MAG: 50S ribosomal protein L29 [Candidatus Aenigmarchaeota archaeon]